MSKDKRFIVLYNEVEELPYDYVICRNSRQDNWILYKGNKRVGTDTFTKVSIAEPDRLIVQDNENREYVIDDAGNIIIPPRDCQFIDYTGQYYIANISGIRKGVAVPQEGYIIDRNGKVLYHCDYDNILYMNGAYLVGEGDITHYTLLSPDFFPIVEHVNILFTHGKNKKTYLIVPIEGKLALVSKVVGADFILEIDELFDDISVEDSVIILRIGDYYGVYDCKTDKLTAVAYDEYLIESNYIILKSQGKCKILDRNTGAESKSIFDEVEYIKMPTKTGKYLSHYRVKVENKRMILDEYLRVKLSSEGF